MLYITQRVLFLLLFLSPWDINLKWTYSTFTSDMCYVRHFTSHFYWLLWHVNRLWYVAVSDLYHYTYNIQYKFSVLQENHFLHEPWNYAARNYAETFLTLLLTHISLFSLIADLVRFNTNNKHHFLTYMITRVFNFTTYICFIIVLTVRSRSNSKFSSFNLSMFTEEDGISINNETEKNSNLEKNAKIYSVLQLLKSSRKNIIFRNYSSGIWGWRFS